MESKETCKWKDIVDKQWNPSYQEYDKYLRIETECGKEVFNKRLLSNFERFIYCPFCVKKIEEVKP